MAKSALSTVRNNESCPKCGAELAIRSGKHGPFPGCSQYPACDYVRPLKSSADGHIVKALEGQVYPVRDANLVLHQGCLDTFIGYNNYPEYEHIELIDKPDETTITCSQCRTGHLVQCRSCYGKTFHSCDCYPGCQFATNSKPTAGECPGRHYLLLIEKKTTQGVKYFRASERCREPVSAG